jgi:hypothetical protein
MIQHYSKHIVRCRANLECLVKEGTQPIRGAKFRKAPSREVALIVYAQAEASNEVAVI